MPTLLVSFRMNRDYLNSGECARLSWDVENVEAVHLARDPVAGHDSKKVCPSETTHYTLRWRHGGQENCRAVTIVVDVPYSPLYY